MYKTAEAIFELIGNKIALKSTKIVASKPDKKSEEQKGKIVQ